ncbi:MAG: cytochrome c biogenesis protein CcdA, partial [Bacteroidia bacterium]
HIEWNTKAVKTGPNEYDLIATATLDKGWHIYSVKVTDEFLIPPTFNFVKGNYQQIGPLKEVGKIISEILKEKDGDTELLYYKDKVDFVHHVKLTGPQTQIKAAVNYTVCDDSQCLPPDDKDFSFAVQFDKNAVASATTEEVTDKPIGTLVQSPNILGGKNAQMQEPTKWDYTVKKLNDTEYELHFTAEIEKGWHIYGTEKTGNDGPTATSFKFKEDENVELIGEMQQITKSVKKYDTVFKLEVFSIENKAEFVQKIKLLKPVKNVTGQVVYMTCNDVQCIPGEADFSFTINKDAAEAEILAPQNLLFSIFGQGFIGGLLALLTPCVFPMIPLTVSFFTKKGQHQRAKSIGSAVLFGVSIIGIYVGLGFLITLIFGSDALSNIASNLYLNFAFFALFFIFALSFLGAFEITLPSSWANKADEKSEKGGLIGIFFMAFTLAIVSFSCTGVIIGTLLVEATKGGYTGPITGMLGFAIALALPFTLFAIFPSWMQSLPKSGGWLNSVKVVLGFIELALAFKFLSTADLIGHWDIFKREYFLVIWIVIFALMGLYLLGKLKFSHDSDVSYISVPRLILAIFSFAFALYMIPGLWGAPTRLLSGLAPPQNYTEGWLIGGGGTHAASVVIDDIDQPKINTKLFHAPPGLTAFFDYEEALAVAKRQNKPLMIDFTGLACVNCRRMEDNVWPHPSVHSKLKSDYVLVQLYVDDKTPLPADQVYTSAFSGKQINTIGKKWSDLQATKYKANSQPYYVLLDHEDNVLAEPRGYDPDIESFSGFLTEGLNAFKSNSKK